MHVSGPSNFKAGFLRFRPMAFDKTAPKRQSLTLAGVVPGGWDDWASGRYSGGSGAFGGTLGYFGHFGLLWRTLKYFGLLW